jgi:ATP-binding cassette subfamily B protein
MRYLIKYFKPYLFLFVILLFLVWGQSQINLILPDYTSKIVNEGIVSKNIATIWSVGVKMLLITVLGGVLTIIVGFLAAKISTGYARRLREAVFVKIEGFSLNEFNAFSSSSLVTRSTNDIQQIQNVISMIMRMSLLAPFMGIGAIIKANQLASNMSLIVLVSICFLSVMIVTLFLVAIPKFTVIQKLVDRLSLQIREMLTGVRVIRAYNKDAVQHKKFNQTNIESTDLNIFINRIMSLMQPVMTLIMGLASVAVVWLGSYMVDAGNLQIGNILALIQYVSQAIMSFLMLSIIFIMVPRAAVSGKRISEILAVSPKINDPVKPQCLPENVQGVIEFKNVGFSYEGSEQPVLTNISFLAKPGQTTAIIGGTGSGKSTLLNLIPRLYDVTVGSITLDGIDIRTISQQELHRYIGYIPQKALLFSGTIKSNIIYGRPNATKDEISRAVETAQASEFIYDSAKGLDSDISQGGDNVSGGQKQRLAIARALVKQSPVFLFDDSFSALDFKTDAALRNALRQELNKSTIIIVGQRISTIMNADNIIVLDNGMIVGQGKHESLLVSCSVYREIAESQLSAAELKDKK